MRQILTGLLVAFALAALPLLPVNAYQIHLATLVSVYWVLIAELNLVVGYCGQLSIGHVGLLAIRAYAYSALVRQRRGHPAGRAVGRKALHYAHYCDLVEIG